MTMPKFEPVAFIDAITERLTTPADTKQEHLIPRFSEDQITEAYEAGKREASEDIEQAAFEKWLYDKCPSGDVESVQRQWLESYEYAELAGKRDAIPEGWVLVPKEPTEKMLRAPWLKIDEQTSFKLKTAHNYYKAMLAAAPKGFK